MSHRTQAPTAQLTLPGQSHTAEGPHDQTGMYVMHHGFRRDLDRFLAAVEITPVSEAEVWAELRRRWDRMAEVLHHHHTVEDEALWPGRVSWAVGAWVRCDIVPPCEWWDHFGCASLSPTGA